MSLDGATRRHLPRSLRFFHVVHIVCLETRDMFSLYSMVTVTLPHTHIESIRQRDTPYATPTSYLSVLPSLITIDAAYQRRRLQAKYR